MRVFRSVVAALVLGLLPSLAAAQSDGRVTGTVRDQSHAFVAGATVFNLFNETNFTNPPATLANALPSNSLTEANKVQPGQTYTAGAAGGAFGRLASTVGTTVGLGTNRQVQLAFRLNF